MEKRIIIAIDGVVGSGKGTLAGLLAKRLGYIHIDSGAMYRAITLYVFRLGIEVTETQKVIDVLSDIHLEFRVNPETQVNNIWLNGENIEDNIRTQDVSTRVPLVAQIPKVREFVNKQQLYLGSRGGAVIEGRDIGTAVFPNAELKIYLTADAQVRAERRHQELVGRGQEASFDEVLETVIARDKADMERELNPLRKASDAIEIDSTHMTIEQVVDRAYKLAQGVIASL